MCPSDLEAPKPEVKFTRLQILKGLRLWHVDACIATAIAVLTTGPFLIGYALYLGCSSFLIGVMGAIPSFIGLLQIVSSAYAERYASRKALVCFSALIARLVWIPVLLIPFVLPRAIWTASFLLLIMLMSAIGTVNPALWTSWISDIVPEGSRGRYFGRRNMYAGITTLVVSITGGAFLDYATKRAGWPQPDAFACLFGLSVFFTIASFITASSVPDIARINKETERPSLRHLIASYKQPFSDLRFRRLILLFVVVAASQAFAGQFFVAYPLAVLHLSYSVLQIINGFSSVTSLASMPVLGYLADKYGNKPILTLCLMLVVAPPVMWNFTSADSYTWFFTDHGGHLLVSSSKLVLVALNLMSGVGWAGVGLTQFNMMIGSAPASTRAIYVSAVSAAVGIAGGVMPLVGGALMQALSGVHFPTHGLVRSNYDVLFVITCVLRIAALLSVRGLLEPKSKSTRYVLDQIRATKPLSSFTALHRLARADSSKGRQVAAARLGQLKTPMAVEELVKALDDVSLPVREQAAVSLGEIGDARAVEPLVSKLTDPASGIAQGAATALGRIGDQSALPALAAAAQLDGPPLRRLAAVEALARMADIRVGDVLGPLIAERDPTMRLAAVRGFSERDDLITLPKIRDELIAQWDRETEPTILAALADILGRLDDAAVAPRLMNKYDRLVSPVVRLELLNTIASLLVGRDSFYAYLALDQFARDETVTKMLTNLQRQLRGKGTGNAREIVRMRQALKAYVVSDYGLSAQRLREAAELLVGSPLLPVPTPSQRSTLDIFHSFSRLAESGHSSTAEETLLLVFLLRNMVGR